VRDDSRRLRWERRTQGPFLILAFLYLVSWTVVAVDSRQLSPLSIAFAVLLVLIWLTFLVDYVVRLLLAADRGRFFVTNVPDLVAAVLPQLRPVVQLRHVRTVPFLARHTGAAQRARIAVFAIAFSVVFVYSIALTVLVAERFAPGAVITNLGDAVWWACVTMFTVGYGDLYPVTTGGRIWAVVLMMGGVAIIGTSSAIVVSYLNERIRQPHVVEQPTLEMDAEPGNADGAAPGEGTAPSERASD